MSQKQPPSQVGAGSKNPASLGDVSFIRATPSGGAFSPLSPSPGREKNTPSGIGMGNPYPHPAIPSASGLSPRLPVEGGGGGGVVVGSGGVGMMGWSEREEMLVRELEEAKVRVGQMEKTMRWWSDCTANWRDKWNKARNERNKAREENRQLRARLDHAVKECTTLKRRLQGRVAPGDPSPPDLKSPPVDTTAANQPVGDDSSKRDSVKALRVKGSPSSSDLSVPSGGVVAKSEKEKQEKELSEKDVDAAEKSAWGGEEGEWEVSTGVLRCFSDGKSSGGPDSVAANVHDENANASAAAAASSAAACEQMVQLQQQIHLAQKTIQDHSQEKVSLTRTIENLEAELSSLRVRCEELKQSRLDLTHQVSKMREDHQNELGRLTSDLEDENSKTSSMDRRLTELRRELERLQAENAAEWQKRERLETDKQTLERENRKLRTQVSDLEEQLQRKHQQAAASVDSDLRTLQFDLSEKNKELTELRHSHSKVRKTLGERLTELEHSKRRADQYEAEVKKLRARVEELKRDLATAEDEVDMQCNSVRRVQRSNDELQEQVDNLTLQVDHLQNRLRRGSQSLPKTRSSSLKSFNMEDSAELADSEDDFDDT